VRENFARKRAKEKIVLCAASGTPPKEFPVGQSTQSCNRAITPGAVEPLHQQLEGGYLLSVYLELSLIFQKLVAQFL
jgi:hypothetical protein